jgi:hypothetical protein
MSDSPTATAFREHQIWLNGKQRNRTRRNRTRLENGGWAAEERAANIGKPETMVAQGGD